MKSFNLTYLDKSGMRVSHCTLKFENQEDADNWVGDFNRNKTYPSAFIAATRWRLGIQCIGSFKLEALLSGFAETTKV